MRHLITILSALLLCSAPTQAQTMKALMYNTNGQVIAPPIAFTNNIAIHDVGFATYGGGTMLQSGGSDVFDITAGIFVPSIQFSSPIEFSNTNAINGTRANLGFSTNLNTLWTANNATNFRAAIGLGATNDVTFEVVNTTSGLRVFSGTNLMVYIGEDISEFETSLHVASEFGVSFSTNNSGAATTRTNLGLGATWLTNTNVSNFRAALGLGENDTPTFSSLSLDSGQIDLDPAETLGQQLTGFTVTTNSVVFSIAAATFLEATTNSWVIHRAPTYSSTNIREQTRDNLLLGSTNIVTFAGLTNNGDIRINQTTPTNGLLFVYRTNNEPFLGIANLIASNNTTVSNETLFRVGVAEATNRSAQFGFRSTNTNGNGVAVFSVFGYNALMQIGADASTNAVIFSGGGTNNEVMTLIRDGATEFARPLRFSTNASTRPSTNAPANTTNVAAWVEMRIGTNSYRVPLYQ